MFCWKKNWRQKYCSDNYAHNGHRFTRFYWNEMFWDGISFSELWIALNWSFLKFVYNLVSFKWQYYIYFSIYLIFWTYIMDKYMIYLHFSRNICIYVYRCWSIQFFAFIISTCILYKGDKFHAVNGAVFFSVSGSCFSLTWRTIAGGILGQLVSSGYNGGWIMHLSVKLQSLSGAIRRSSLAMQILSYYNWFL